MWKRMSVLFLMTLWIVSNPAPAAVTADNGGVCPQALPTDSPAFCESFVSVARCHCIASGMSKIFCQNVGFIYKTMIALYGSVENACAHQHDTDAQNCIDDWHCYRSGGSDSAGRLCSGTGKACA